MLPSLIEILLQPALASKLVDMGASTALAQKVAGALSREMFAELKPFFEELLFSGPQDLVHSLQEVDVGQPHGSEGRD